jgi:hypothetical protein
VSRRDQQHHAGQQRNGKKQREREEREAGGGGTEKMTHTGMKFDGKSGITGDTEGWREIQILDSYCRNPCGSA